MAAKKTVAKKVVAKKAPTKPAQVKAKIEKFSPEWIALKIEGRKKLDNV